MLDVLKAEIRSYIDLVIKLIEWNADRTHLKLA
jgi:hypothetical protein